MNLPEVSVRIAKKLVDKFCPEGHDTDELAQLAGAIHEELAAAIPAPSVAPGWMQRAAEEINALSHQKLIQVQVLSVDWLAAILSRHAPSREDTDAKRYRHLKSLARPPNWERDWPMCWRLDVWLNVSNRDGKKIPFDEAVDEDAAMKEAK